MIRIGATAILSTVALAATLVVDVPAPAAAGCKLQKLVGRYGFLATGNAIGQTDNQPYASGVETPNPGTSRTIQCRGRSASG